MMLFVDLTCELTCFVLGITMGNVAETYGALGRHQDALVLKEKTLEFFRRVLPENHPNIGMLCYNISSSYFQAGDYHRAIERAREALRIWQATLPPLHPQVKTAQEQVRQIEGEIARRA